MRFLIDACLPRDFYSLISSFGHHSVDVRDIDMGRADDPDVAAHARAHQLCLMTEDCGFSDIRIYPPEQHHGIVVIEASDNGIDDKVAALRNLLEHPEFVFGLLFDCTRAIIRLSYQGYRLELLHVNQPLIRQLQLSDHRQAQE